MPREPKASAEARLSGASLAAAIATAARWLEQNAAAVDAINVFPVPDGDTGTNMTLTLRTTVAEMEGLGPNPALSESAAAAARGALLGARGNSGVILSQWFRGLAASLDGVAEADGRAIGVALGSAAQAASGAMAEPREGTMITVARASAELDPELDPSATPVDVIEHALALANEAVAKTPEQMPLLAEAGVVDAGGRGLALLLEGLVYSLRGEALPQASTDAGRIDPSWLVRAETSAAEGRYGLCTEFNVVGAEIDVEGLRVELGTIGDSVIVVGDTGTAHAHVHTTEPEAAYRAGERQGQVESRKAEDMHAQHGALVSRTAEAAGPAVVAVASGEGFTRLLRELGAATIVDGGETFNPSAESLLEAARGTHARDVILLPDHVNVVPAAEQAAALSEGVRIHVTPTTSMPQGVAALLALDRTAPAEEAARRMGEAADSVLTGAVTWAARAVSAPVPLRPGQPFALVEREIVCAAETVEGALAELVATMRKRKPEGTLLTVYAGERVDEAEAEAAASRLAEGEAEGLEVEIVIGGQPHYPYLASLE